MWPSFIDLHAAVPFPAPLVEETVFFLFYILGFISRFSILLHWSVCLFFVFFFFLFVCFVLLIFSAVLTVYGSSQDRGWNLLAYTKAPATWDLGHICTLLHSSWQCWVPYLREARDWTASSWILIEFVSAVPQWEGTPVCLVLYQYHTVLMIVAL